MTKLRVETGRKKFLDTVELSGGKCHLAAVCHVVTLCDGSQVWSLSVCINTREANVCWRYGIHLHALSPLCRCRGPCRPVSRSMSPHILCTRCQRHTYWLVFPESPGARKPGLGNWRGHPVSIIRANLFSLGGLRLPGHRWGQTVRSSLMPTENARTGWERDVDQGQRDRSLRESWHFVRVCKSSLKMQIYGVKLIKKHKKHGITGTKWYTQYRYLSILLYACYAKHYKHKTCSETYIKPENN